jgi:hypothetical protein
MVRGFQCVRVMPPAAAHLAADAPTSGDELRVGEELLVACAGPWRLLVPLRHVTRVHAAALPAAQPAGAAVAPIVVVDGARWPVVFAAALVGATEVRLRAGDQLIALEHGERRALLWVNAVEDVVAHAPAPDGAPPPPAALLAAHSGPRALSVLDVPRLLLSLAASPAEPGEP